MFLFILMCLLKLHSVDACAPDQLTDNYCNIPILFSNFYISLSETYDGFRYQQCRVHGQTKDDFCNPHNEQCVRECNGKLLNWMFVSVVVELDH